MAATALALVLLALAGCQEPPPGGQELAITADTTDPDLIRPGVVFRHGPALAEVVAGPVYPPVVRGYEGQVSIYDGFFVRGPCTLPLQVEASHWSDTILVRLVAIRDTTRVECAEGDHPIGYSMLVGQFDPGDYAVRVVHEGDLARSPQLDTVYESITIEPRSP